MRKPKNSEDNTQIDLDRIDSFLSLLNHAPTSCRASFYF